jgi:aminoglycoside phosphotransferase (APT) family kinase protein
MQERGLTHGDAHLHNFIVCPSPLEVVAIDFEMGVLKESVEPAVWRERCRADRQHLLKLAVYLQCALGRQRGTLADESMAALEELVRPVNTFRDEITERTFDTAFT